MESLRNKQLNPPFMTKGEDDFSFDEPRDVGFENQEAMEKNSQSRFSNKLLVSSVVLIAVLVLAGIMLIYRVSFGAKPPNVSHGSWSSGIDNNRHKLNGQSFPLRFYTSAHNWLNRKKRLLWARRTRRSSRLSNQPVTRAMHYYNNGRLLNNQSVSRNGTSSQDNDTTAVLMSVKAPIRNLVSNPNYISENEKRLLENSGMSNWVRLAKLIIH